MARRLIDVPNVDAATGDYPFGRQRDKSVGVIGTPVTELLYGDKNQFFEKLLLDAGVIPNGLPENVTNGYQYVEALDNRFQPQIENQNDLISLVASELQNLTNTVNNIPTPVYNGNKTTHDFQLMPNNGQVQNIDIAALNPPANATYAIITIRYIPHTTLETEYCFRKYGSTQDYNSVFRGTIRGSDINYQDFGQGLVPIDSNKKITADIFYRDPADECYITIMGYL